MTELQAKRIARVRDGGKCVVCMRPGAFTLHAHHIYPKSLFPERAADVSNLVSVCVACHLGLIHGGRITDGGDPNGRWKAWQNFLFQQITESPDETFFRAIALGQRISNGLR